MRLYTITCRKIVLLGHNEKINTGIRHMVANVESEIYLRMRYSTLQNSENRQSNHSGFSFVARFTDSIAFRIISTVGVAEISVVSVDECPKIQDISSCSVPSEYRFVALVLLTM